MKRNLAINIVLALVLCISQISANIHAAGHLQTQNTKDHHIRASNGELLHFHSEIEDIHYGEFANDCAAYHMLAAMSGIGPASASTTEKRTKLPAFVNVQASSVVARSVNTKPIRGPPIYS